MNNKSTKYLSKFDLMKGVALKKDSADWLVSCLDPYHDYQLEPHGLPDERTAPSVVQVHNQTYTLTKPTSAGTGNWDASVCFSGINSVINAPTDRGGLKTVPSSSFHEYDATSLSTGVPFGALNIWAGAAGATMSTGAPATVNETYHTLGSVLTTDRCRLIGVAFEIHNTTAEIYRQGSLTVAQLPDTATDANIVEYINIAVGGTLSLNQADRAMLLASTSQPLMAVPGSQTWPASDGCYCIPRMAVVPRDIASYYYDTTVGSIGANCRVPILYGTDGKTATPEPSGVISTTTGSIELGLFLPRYNSGFSPVQSFLTGLSNQTTLTITFRSIVEYFPALTSPLLPLSSPSSEYDARAFEVYALLISKLPYANKVQDNSAGDYFRKVVAVMRSALGHAGPILTSLAPVLGEFGPLASAAGGMLTTHFASKPRFRPLPPTPKRK